MRTLWMVGLFVLCVAWGAAMTDIVGGSNEPWPAQLLAGVGFALPVFVGTGIAAGVAYVVTKNPTKALIVWTILLLVAAMIVGIGAAYSVRKTLEERTALSAGQE